METIRLGGIGPEVARLGFGCEQLGGFAWGEVHAEEVVSAVHAALEAGVNLFDTADVYALGRSEELLGKILVGKRHRAFLATKFGVRRTAGNAGSYFDSSPGWMREAVEGSLQRLRTDWIDLYQVHYWDKQTPIEETFAELEALRTQGKIRWYGVTNFDPSQLGMRERPPGLVSFSFEHSLAHREHENEARDLSLAHGLSLISWGSLGQGILSGKYTRDSRLAEGDRRNRETYVNFHGERLDRNMRILEEMKRILRAYPGKTLSQLAIRWVLDSRPGSLALAGIKRLSQFEDLLGALDWSLDKQHFRALQEVSGQPLTISSGSAAQPKL